jgi:hypothetical protein
MMEGEKPTQHIYSKGQVVNENLTVLAAEDIVYDTGKRAAGYRVLCKCGQEAVVQRAVLYRQRHCSLRCPLLARLRKEEMSTRPVPMTQQAAEAKRERRTRLKRGPYTAKRVSPLAVLAPQQEAPVALPAPPAVNKIYSDGRRAVVVEKNGAKITVELTAEELAKLLL